MDCPYCNKAMKRGYIRCHSDLFPMVWKSQEDDSTRKIQPWYMNLTKVKLEDVYFCPDCDILIKKVTMDK